ncbi:MAG: hypothetical protein ACAH83_05325 [Alphaproteobacteria bacterium]
MNIFRFLPLVVLGALIIPAPALAQNEPMGASSFSGMDVEGMAGAAMMESSQDNDEDLKDQMRKVREQNEKRKAQRDAANKMKNEKDRLKAVAVMPGVRPVNANPSGKIIPPPKTVPAGPEAKKLSIEDLKDEKDSAAEMGKQDQLNFQGDQERSAKVRKTLSDVVKKSSDTNSAISGNLK